MAEIAPIIIIPYNYYLIYFFGSFNRFFSACFSQLKKACAEYIRRRVNIFKYYIRFIIPFFFPFLPLFIPLVCVNSRELILNKFIYINFIKSKNFVRLFNLLGRIFFASSPININFYFPFYFLFKTPYF